jgi:hypothetical protein
MLVTISVDITASCAAQLFFFHIISWVLVNAERFTLRDTATDRSHANSDSVIKFRGKITPCILNYTTPSFCISITHYWPRSKALSLQF